MPRSSRQNAVAVAAERTRRIRETSDPYSDNIAMIRVFDRAAGRFFTSSSNILAEVYEQVKAVTIQQNAPDADHPITIFLPAGSIIIEPTILDTDHIHISGAVVGATELVGDGTTGGADGLLTQTCDYCNISDLTIHATAGNCLHQDGSSTSARSSEVERCRFVVDGGGGAAGIKLARGSFSLCRFDGGVGVDTTQDMALFDGCKFYVDVLTSSPGGGVFKNCYSEVVSSILGAEPLYLTQFINHVNFGGSSLFAATEKIIVINCSLTVGDGCYIFDNMRASGLPCVTIVGGCFIAGGSGAVFAADSVNPIAEIAGQPLLAGNLFHEISGGEVLTLRGVGHTLLRDAAAASSDGEIVYDQSGDAYLGQAAGASKTFTVT